MKERILALLTENTGCFLSGEAMSAALGISRAAVWKSIEALRREGVAIEAIPRRGYRLTAAADRLTPGSIVPWLRRDDGAARLIVLDTVDSTNNYAKKLAMAGGFRDGTAVVAEEQTGGRGRLGRSFQSPRGRGIYLTLLWKPDVPPPEAVNLTAFAAVAVCEGIDRVCGVRPGIKWTNDIVLDSRKLCGILTEMAVEGESGSLQYLIVGVGVNANHAPEDFSPEVRPMAVSLSQILKKPVDRGKLCAGLIDAMDEMYGIWRTGGADYRQRYRDSCITLGKPVRLLRNGHTENAFAEDLDEGLGLIVRRPDGTRETVTAGEVSVRGLWGYSG